MANFVEAAAVRITRINNRLCSCTPWVQPIVFGQCPFHVLFSSKQLSFPVFSSYGAKPLYNAWASHLSSAHSEWSLGLPILKSHCPGMQLMNGCLSWHHSDDPWWTSPLWEGPIFFLFSDQIQNIRELVISLWVGVLFWKRLWQGPRFPDMTKCKGTRPWKDAR